MTTEASVSNIKDDMNYLAHLYLSGNSDEIMVGNFIGDQVKGNKYRDFPSQISYGIHMHRHIDSYTDQHLLVKESMKLLKPAYGRYSGIVTDIFFDHFLAANWAEHSNITLKQFSKHAHAVLLTNFLILPFQVKQFLPFLIQHKRLESYANKSNLFQVLEIMSKRTTLPSNSQWAMEILEQEYGQFEALFRSFFSDLVYYSESEFNVQILKPDQKSSISA